MGKLRHSINRSKNILLNIHFVDKCLILFMFILLTQSAISLFHSGTPSKAANDIDIVIRTSSAAIFGYFISGNFIRRASKQSDIEAAEVLPQGTPDEATPTESVIEYSTNKTQVIIATVIGLFCLIMLIVQRDLSWSNIALANASTSPTISQFRDFVSGCVGFLIGTPTHRSSR